MKLTFISLIWLSMQFLLCSAQGVPTYWNNDADVLRGVDRIQLNVTVTNIGEQIDFNENGLRSEVERFLDEAGIPHSQYDASQETPMLNVAVILACHKPVQIANTLCAYSTFVEFSEGVFVQRGEEWIRVFWSPTWTHRDLTSLSTDVEQTRLSINSRIEDGLEVFTLDYGAVNPK